MQSREGQFDSSLTRP
nr:unnamed protein product [Callosobruchus chinensis]CAH7719675.1 unnamed protein product [Callosobruchus chinensis]CAH7748755.1 unnamed protein product [Callosobruchus chinensis]CAH7752762.1 unnamed protein product [Callosobruchus chinensis]CAH7754342.1 unnamed protein product [Callosobruchus chinensis]